MSVTKIRKGAITIPAEIRKKANLEDGAIVAVEYISDDGIIVLRPEVSINHENYVKLSKKGEIMIEEALDAEKNGDIIGPFSDIEKALKVLKES